MRLRSGNHTTNSNLHHTISDEVNASDAPLPDVNNPPLHVPVNNVTVDGAPAHMIPVHDNEGPGGQVGAASQDTSTGHGTLDTTTTCSGAPPPRGAFALPKLKAL